MGFTDWWQWEQWLSGMSFQIFCLNTIPLCFLLYSYAYPSCIQLWKTYPGLHNSHECRWTIISIKTLIDNTLIDNTEPLQHKVDAYLQQAARKLLKLKTSAVNLKCLAGEGWSSQPGQPGCLAHFALLMHKNTSLKEGQSVSSAPFSCKESRLSLFHL